MEDLKIEYLAPGELKAYERNAKLHPEYQIEQIIESIQKAGFNDPIGIWSNENIIVEGHGRLEAAKRMKVEKVPCIRLDHMTADQRRAYALIHNKTTMNSGFDEEMLQKEIQELIDAIPEIDFKQFDFDIELPDTEPPEDYTDNLMEGGELDTDEFSDSQFNCKCPKCGFLFSVEGKGNV